MATWEAINTRQRPEYSLALYDIVPKSVMDPGKTSQVSAGCLYV